MPETQNDNQNSQISSDMVHEAIEEAGLSNSTVAMIGSALGLGQEEIDRVLGGSPLSMSPEQYTNLRQKFGDAYSNIATDGQTGGSCGCSGSPTTSSNTTTTATPAAATPQTAAVTTTKADIAETNAGTTGHTASTQGGTISLRTGVEGTLGTRTLQDMFTISYTGPDSQNAHLLQFIWREVIGTHSDGTHHPITGSITTSGGTYNLTTGGTNTTFGTPGQANWNTDTASSSDPFYEAAFASNRTANSTTLYDLPSNMTSKVQQAFGAGATSVVSRAHFVTFLVMGDDVKHRMELDISWAFPNAAATPSRVQTPGAAGAATSLSPDSLKNKFHAQFPTYNYIT